MADHPAKFSTPIIARMEEIIGAEARRFDNRYLLPVLDPFAGTGRIHELSWSLPTVRTVGVEIEPEWAKMDPWTIVGNALALPFPASRFYVVATSPTYGNRMADHHNAKDASKRITYKHTLGRNLHPLNSGQLHWGPKYMAFHVQAWKEVTRVLVPNGLFVLNVSNFMKTFKGVQDEIDVVGWHIDTVVGMGYRVEEDHQIITKRMKMGANGTARVAGERLIAFRREPRP